MIFNRQTRIRPLAALLFIAIQLLFTTVDVFAKRVAVNDEQGTDNDIANLTSAEIEAKFRPFFEERIKNRRERGNIGHGHNSNRQTNRLRPTSNDYRAIMRAWDMLSPEFRALYAEASNIYPEDYQAFHISPMGKFKIFYSIDGENAVNPLVDTIGYGVSGDRSLWRQRTSAPNGVPDYVDETAFALDSAWSLVIDRFGFREPLNIVAPDDGSTDYYSVLILKMYDGDYGATIPQGNRPLTDGGFPSYIELNSDWSSPIWSSAGYDKKPYNAVRITCAHEMLHTSQYAMVWTINLDNLTYGWLEGSAVLIEDIAFPYVNDYLNYTGQYFRNPGITILGNSNIYMNGLVLKYIYEKTNLTDSIAFIKAVHENNYIQRQISFHNNLERASLEHVGKPWAEIQNGFHTESYFTRNRARRPEFFVSDAELMDSWAAPVISGETETKTANARAAVFFRYEPRTEHPDTLTLRIDGQRDASIGGFTWAASAIITESNGNAQIVKIPVDQNGIGILEIPDWKDKAGCLIVASNASPSYRRTVTVRFYGNGTDPNDPPKPNTPLIIAPNIVKIHERTPIRIYGGNVTEIKLVTLEGKIIDYYGASKAANPGFRTNTNDDAIEWYPNNRTAPGVSYIFVTSQDPISNRKTTIRNKIMILR